MFFFLFFLFCNRPTGQTECPIRIISFVSASVNRFSIFNFALFDLSGHFSRWKVKTSHRLQCLSRAYTKTNLHGQKEWPIRKCDGLFFPRWSQLVDGTIFRFALIELNGNFHGQWLMRLISAEVPSHKLHKLHTYLHVRGSVWSTTVAVSFFRLEVSKCLVLSLCLYSLTLLVIFKVNC